jgi:hypothetical protein
MNACHSLLVRIGMKDKAEGGSDQGADQTHHPVKGLSPKFGKSHGEDLLTLLCQNIEVSADR